MFFKTVVCFEVLGSFRANMTSEGSRRENRKGYVKHFLDVLSKPANTINVSAFSLSLVVSLILGSPTSDHFTA